MLYIEMSPFNKTSALANSLFGGHKADNRLGNVYICSFPVRIQFGPTACAKAIRLHLWRIRNEL